MHAEKQDQLLRGKAVGRMGIVKCNEKPGQRELIIFGVRPSMVVDFEEACIRAGIAIRASVSPADTEPLRQDRQDAWRSRHGHPADSIQMTAPGQTCHSGRCGSGRVRSS